MVAVNVILGRATGSLGKRVGADDIAEAVAVNGALSAADRASLTSYFGTKYGITVA